MSVDRVAFPNARNVLRTSDATDRYNCFAWAAGADDCFWDPRLHWPDGATRGRDFDALKSAYATLGFAPCTHGELEAGIDKIAIYATLASATSPARPTHAARQLPSGRWTSKLGADIDVEHDLADLEGPGYGRALYFLARPRHTAVTPPT